MIGLQSNFGPSLALAAVVALSTSLAALVVAWRRHAAGDPWQAPAARVFAIGAIIVVIAATALRRRFGIDTDGDLVLRLGRAGLADWRVAFRDPGSLPAIQLFSNVLLHAPVGFGLRVAAPPTPDRAHHLSRLVDRDRNHSVLRSRPRRGDR